MMWSGAQPGNDAKADPELSGSAFLAVMLELRT
jgi:hypothetical protein